jgi:hypothetical protein
MAPIEMAGFTIMYRVTPLAKHSNHVYTMAAISATPHLQKQYKSD